MEELEFKSIMRTKEVRPVKGPFPIHSVPKTTCCNRNFLTRANKEDTRAYHLEGELFYVIFGLVILFKFRTFFFKKYFNNNYLYNI